MKFFLDTTVLVDLERKREETLLFLERAQTAEHDLWISTVSISEIFTGVYLRRDAEKAAAHAREALGHFEWRTVDAEVAVATGQLLAYVMAHGRPIGYPDAVIAASSLVEAADHLVTENLEHFRAVPALEGRVVNTKEALRLVSKNHGRGPSRA